MFQRCVETTLDRKDSRNEDGYTLDLTVTTGPTWVHDPNVAQQIFQMGCLRLRYWI